MSSTPTAVVNRRYPPEPACCDRHRSASTMHPLDPPQAVITDARTFQVAGSPIGGENPPHDTRWRHLTSVAATAR